MRRSRDRGTRHLSPGSGHWCESATACLPNSGPSMPKDGMHSRSRERSFSAREQAFWRRRPVCLAFVPADRYLTCMSQKVRRVMTLLLTITLIVGLVPHGLRAADMDMKMIMAVATDMPMSGKCDCCGDDQKAMTSAVCSAHCGGFVALPLIGMLFEPSSVETVGDLPGPTPAGHAIPPDPYPPRPAILS